VLAVDDRHVAFCEYNGSVARIICVAVATLANEKLLETSLLLSPSDGLASFLKTTLANGVKVVKKVIASKFRFHLIAIYALGAGPKQKFGASKKLESLVQMA
jgi:hypothetical protein